MSPNDLIYSLGQTNIAVGLSLNVQVIPPPACKSIAFKWLSGGTLAIVSGVTSAANPTTAGYIMGTSEAMALNGPATFFLAAAGSTSIVGVIFGLTKGYSQLP